MTYSLARSQLLGQCSNDMEAIEQIKNTSQSSNKLKGGMKKKSRKPMDQNSEDLGRLEEIH